MARRRLAPADSCRRRPAVRRLAVPRRGDEQRVDRVCDRRRGAEAESLGGEPSAGGRRRRPSRQSLSHSGGEGARAAPLLAPLTRTLAQRAADVVRGNAATSFAANARYLVRLADAKRVRPKSPPPRAQLHGTRASHVAGVLLRGLMLPRAVVRASAGQRRIRPLTRRVRRASTPTAFCEPTPAGWATVDKARNAVDGALLTATRRAAQRSTLATSSQRRCRSRCRRRPTVSRRAAPSRFARAPHGLVRCARRSSLHFHLSRRVGTCL